MSMGKIAGVSSVMVLAVALVGLSGAPALPATVDGGTGPAFQRAINAPLATTTLPRARERVSVALALQKYPQLASLPDGGTIVSTTNHKSWWVEFASAPSVTIMTLLARLGVGWGYSATPPFATGADARLNPAAMTQAQLIRAGLPLPPSRPGTSAYATWLTSVRSLLPRLHVSDHVRKVVSPVKSWYDGTTQFVNWAGYVNNNNTYAGIQAQFHMANTAYTLSKGQGITQWVGLGGINGSGLAQAGAIRTNPGDVSGQSQSHLFVEAIYGFSNCFLYRTGGFAPGDDIWAQVRFLGYQFVGGVNYAKYEAIALDGLNGDSTGWQSFSCGSGFSPNSADSILETPFQPTANGGYYMTLPPFSSLTPFFNVYTYTGAGEANGEVAPYELAELRAPGDKYGPSNATPTGWSSQTAFSVNYGTSQ